MIGYDYTSWTTAPWWFWPSAVAVLALGLWFNALILRKMGFSQWWALLYLVQPFYVVGLWLAAFSRWPRVDRVRVTPPSDYGGGWNVSGKDE